MIPSKMANLAQAAALVLLMITSVHAGQGANSDPKPNPGPSIGGSKEPKRVVDVTPGKRAAVAFALVDIGQNNSPLEVRDRATLFQAVGDEALRAAILAQVDFRKQVLLIFKWRGSGQDKLVVSPDPEAKTVEFTVQRGRTKDLHPHLQLRAVSKKASWSISK